MDTHTTYQEAAQSYADRVRVLFAPSGVLTGERGAAGPASPAELAAQATQLAPLSDELTRAAAARLDDPDPLVRVQASTQLLAKAMTDLEISAYLLQSAQDEEDRIGWSDGAGAQRSSAGRGTITGQLHLLTSATDRAAAERGTPAPRDLPAARAALSSAVEDALMLIPERAGTTGQVALSGLLGLGLAEVAEAAGMVGMNIAQALGQAERVTQLYNLFRDFAIKTYESLVALLGQQLAREAAAKVLEWVNELQEGKLFGELLEKLYETAPTLQELRQLLEHNQADLAHFTDAIRIVEGLDAAYRQQIELAEKLLKGLRFVGSLAVAVLPHARLLMAASYIVLGAYVILCGADYVDARALGVLDRVPGVRRVVEANLARG